MPKVSATFTFRGPESNVGENLQSQLVLASHAHQASAPLFPSHVKITFDGDFQDVTIRNNREEDVGGNGQTVQVIEVPLQKRSRTFSSASSSSRSSSDPFSNECIGRADLCLRPGAITAFTFNHIPRTAGPVEVQSVGLCLASPDFDLEIITTEVEQMDRDEFLVLDNFGPSRRKIHDGQSTRIQIMPRPSRIRMSFDHLAATYFTDEIIITDLRIVNEEDVGADILVEARLLGPAGLLPRMTWTQGGTASEPDQQDSTERTSDQQKGPSQSKYLGIIQPLSEQKHALRIEVTPEVAEYSLEVRAKYHLIEDPETAMVNSISVHFNVALPFEVSYDFVPMIFSEPWPSFFEVDTLRSGSNNEGEGEGGEGASGLRQDWSLTSRLYCLANIPLVVKGSKLQMLEIHEESTCIIRNMDHAAEVMQPLAPGEVDERNFILEVQKKSLEDRQSSFLDLRLEVEWCREGSQDSLVLSHLAVPELCIPFGEPRVLATVRNVETPSGVINLEYIIENPSMYTLTFSLTMETSEEFSFSGVKNVSIQLLPLSRHDVRYTLIPLVKGAWLNPHFRVFDTHFHKMLKVQATKGIRADKRGISIWSDAEG